MDGFFDQPGVFKFFMNWFPCYRRTGARILSISPDWHHVKIVIPLNWKTRNYVGTTFGGSMYGAVDPVYMMMLIKLLGHNYIVWDKAANIRFRKPGRTDLYVDFHLDKDEVKSIRNELKFREKTDRIYQLNIVDDAGVVHAEIEKTVHIRNRASR